MYSKCEFIHYILSFYIIYFYIIYIHIFEFIDQKRRAGAAAYQEGTFRATYTRAWILNEITSPVKDFSSRKDWIIIGPSFNNT